MKLRMRAAGFELNPETRRSVERHVRLALGRHAPDIAEVRVGLARGAEPRCDVTRCRIRLRLREGEAIRVEDLGKDPYESATRACWRAALRLNRWGRLAGRSTREALYLNPRFPQGGSR